MAAATRASTHGHMDKNIVGRVTRLEGKLDYIVDALDAHGRSLKDLSSQVSAASRTDWKLVLAGLAVMITIATSLVTPPVLFFWNSQSNTTTEVKRLGDVQSSMSSRLVAQERNTDLYDQRMTRQFNEARDDVRAIKNEIDVVLQREMELKDWAHEAELWRNGYLTRPEDRCRATVCANQ